MSEAIEKTINFHFPALTDFVLIRFEAHELIEYWTSKINLCGPFCIMEDSVEEVSDRSFVRQRLQDLEKALSPQEVRCDIAYMYANGNHGCMDRPDELKKVLRETKSDFNPMAWDYFLAESRLDYSRFCIEWVSSGSASNWQSPDEPHELYFENVDNRVMDLRGLGVPFDVVNGWEAMEVPGYILTTEELGFLINRWKHFQLAQAQVNFLNGEIEPCAFFRQQFAARRISRIADLIGWVEVDKIVVEIFEQSKNDADEEWRIFLHGSDNERNQLQAMHNAARILRCKNIQEANPD